MRIAISCGDPAGIGPEITLLALTDSALRERFEPVIVGSRPILARTAAALGLAALLDEVEVHDVMTPGIERVRPGVVSAEAGRAAYEAIVVACELARGGAVDALCTAPIHKEALRLAGVPEIGHTEILAELLSPTRGRPADALTLFITGSLRIFFYSRHLSLRQAIDALAIEPLAAFAERAASALASYGFRHPRLALAALNPHASDGGQFGDEEARILAPAVARARARGVDVQGPLPADSVFHQAAEGHFDAVLSLYHDQGHIAAKTRDFHGTVSATLGLGVLRTSVDHGTAMDIAGRGLANPASMKAALAAAIELSERRL